MTTLMTAILVAWFVSLFFGGIALKSAGAQGIAGSLDAHCRNEYHAVLFEYRPGAGRTMTLAVDFDACVYAHASLST